MGLVPGRFGIPIVHTSEERLSGARLSGSSGLAWSSLSLCGSAAVKRDPCQASSYLGRRRSGLHGLRLRTLGGGRHITARAELTCQDKSPIPLVFLSYAWGNSHDNPMALCCLLPPLYFLALPPGPSHVVPFGFHNGYPNQSQSKTNK